MNVFFYLLEVQVLRLVHELKAKDIEEYRKKIVERDKDKDKDSADERRRDESSRASSKGERSKLDGGEGCGKVKEDVHGSDDPRNDRGERFPSPAAVFTFDQEEIHASKLLSFDKVGHDQNLCI